jgi:putative CocE/NonD family hydrolase
MTRFVRLVLLAVALPLVPAEAQRVGVPRFGVVTPMRDGVKLVANLWLPDSVGRFPTILFRTPYDKTPVFKRYGMAAYVKAGYAVMIQDTRGRGDSEGEFDYLFPEGTDGYDTIEWIARQPWSDGKVGMEGGSYMGTVQYLAARERPPHLTCIAPIAAAGQTFAEVPYAGGAFKLSWALSWIPLVQGRVWQADLSEQIDLTGLAARRPLVRLDTLLGRPMRLYQDVLAHPTLDAWWKRIQFGPTDFERIQLPVFTVTGWFDGDQVGTLFYWAGLQRRNDPKAPRWLLIGPWTHGQTYLGGATSVGGFTFDSTSILPIQQIRIQYYDWCLKGRPAFERPRVQVFVMGANRWRTANDYPLPDMVETPLYLRSTGRANTLNGDGALSWSAPEREPADEYLYDPRNPAPMGQPGEDHRKIEERQDVLVYTTAPLTEKLEIVGPISVDLHATTDGRDTDFMARMLDVFPDGRSIAFGPAGVGAIRARYRESVERATLLEPGRAYRYTIDLGHIGYEFQPGHRIRLEITSSAAPNLDPNPNTGNPVATDTASRVARQTIHHDLGRPSRLLLPVIRNSVGSAAERGRPSVSGVVRSLGASRE